MANNKFVELGKFFLLLTVVLVITYSVSNFIGLSRTGFESSEIFDLQTFYLIGGIFALILVVMKFYAVFIPTGDSTYGNSIGFNDLGETPHLGFFRNWTNIQLTWASVILFFSLALVSIVFLQQNSFTGLGTLPQQFSPTDSVLYSTALIPGAENLGSAVVIGFFIIVLGIFAVRYDLSQGNYVTLLWFLIPVSTGLFGVGNHIIRYSGSDVALLTVFAFWTFGGLVTQATGSFIPFWIMHISNNLMIDVQRFFSSDILLISFGIGLFVLASLYFFVYGLKKGFLGTKS